jgi:hypothetical protein
MQSFSAILRCTLWKAMFCYVLLPTLAVAAPPSVLEPVGNVNRVPAGYDFATQELGDPWDMDRIEDTFTPDSRELANETVANGIYSFDTIEDALDGLSKAQFWLIYPGLNNSQRLVSEARDAATGRRIFTREKFPINTSVYRYLTARVRMTSATGQPLDRTQRFIVFYFEDATSIGNALYGGTNAVLVPPNEWTTVKIDLAANVDQSLPESWSLLPQVEGLRIDPTSQPGVHVEVDWIRLTSEPDPDEYFSVSWNGNGAAEYSVAARAQGVEDADSYELVSAVVGNSVDVALSDLPPGSYRIEVTADAQTGLSPGVVVVNEAPLIEITAPNIKGEQSLGYGAAAASNPWDQIDAGDVLEALDFVSYSYSNPVGSFSGRPTGSNSRILMNTPTPIDTAFYRMLCYEAEISGPRNIGLGSVTKVLWGNQRAQLTTPAPVIAQEGLNEYCLGDMAKLRINAADNPDNEGAWIGPVKYIRFDPHEFSRSAQCNSSPSAEACRDVQFKSMILAPMHRANPEFTFQWRDSDNDDSATVAFWLDDDRIPGNTPESTEHLVGSAAEDSPVNSLNWTPPDDIAAGVWNVYAVIDDGLNFTVRYASGPLIVGPPSVARVSVAVPDGVNDKVLAGDEYGLRQRLDQWDMDNSELNLALTKNINNVNLSGGIFSGTTANNNSQFILMTSGEGDPVIQPSNWRYLTLKMRISGVPGPHFVQAFYSSAPAFDPATAGFTNGIPIDEGVWSLVTFDLFTNVGSAFPASWSQLSEVNSIRIDPTNSTGAQFEIDWITLSAPPTPSTEFKIQWTAENTGTSGFDVNIVDALGHRYRVATGLPALAREHSVNFAHLPLGEYFAEVIASPGPASLSPGSISLVNELMPAGILFSNGFE